MFAIPFLESRSSRGSSREMRTSHPRGRAAALRGTTFPIRGWFAGRSARGRCAFTLIEVLVVVAIIALLLSILLPSLQRAREQGQQAVCLANQHTLALAFVQYAAEFRDAIVMSFTDQYSWVDWPKLPNGHYLTESELQRATDIEAHKRGIRDGKLYRYTKTVEVYHCPSDGRDRRVAVGGSLAYVTYSMLNCMNGDDGWESTIGGTHVTKVTSAIRRPADKIVFVEESDPRGLNMGSWVMYLNREEWIDPLTVWHHGCSTLGFADGHAFVRRWVDPRTVKMSQQQQFYQQAQNNADWRYMKQSWTIAK